MRVTVASVTSVVSGPFTALKPTSTFPLASIIFFSALERLPALYPLLINVLLALTSPVTTVLLARAALQRAREANADVPPALAVQEPQPPD